MQILHKYLITAGCELEGCFVFYLSDVWKYYERMEFYIDGATNKDPFRDG